MTTTELRTLGVLGGQLGSNTIQQLDVTLMRILLESGDESPRHGSRRLTSDRCVGPVVKQKKFN